MNRHSGAPTILRRTLTPYIGQTAILIGVTVLTAYVAQEKRQWGLLWGLLVIWPLFAADVYFFGMKYRIWWNDVGVTMSASGGPERHVSFDDVSEVRYEIASGGEFLSQSRPFRRIAIFGSSAGPSAPIDISLRHFRLEDIEKLLIEIRKRRPDLALPAIPRTRRSTPRSSTAEK